MNGFINILKPTGMTSSNVVSKVRWCLNMKKVGHAGTLDPAAVGVLPIMLGRATKLFDYLNMDRKQYIAEYTFGVHTSSLDVQGDIISQNDIITNEEEIREILPKFVGDIQQIPPKISAININGKRAYDLARAGVEFKIKPRNVTIYNYEIIRKTHENAFLLDIECSKGTYIRSLCRDLAKQLDTLAYISYLSRIRSGYFHINDAITIEELEEFSKDGSIKDYIIKIDEPLDHICNIKLDSKYMKKIINGISVKVSDREDKENIKVYCMDSFIGIGKINQGTLSMRRIMYE